MDVSLTTNACAGIPANDCAELRGAAEKLLDARNVVIKLADYLGDKASWAGTQVTDKIKEKFGIDIPDKIHSAANELLWNFQNGSMIAMDKDGVGDRWEWLHKGIVVASGASGGFFGVPGLIWDLPITTVNIMRSVADIARAYPGEDISTDSTKRACIEVLAMGSPLIGDEEAELGYWTSRLAVNHVSIELLIKAVAARYSITISEKLLAQAVPVVGAIAGGALNYAYIDYYQEMARVHFAVRSVERRSPDPSAVRPCFDVLVRAVREGRKIGQTKKV